MSRPPSSRLRGFPDVAKTQAMGSVGDVKTACTWNRSTGMSDGSLAGDSQRTSSHHSAVCTIPVGDYVFAVSSALPTTAHCADPRPTKFEFELPPSSAGCFPTHDQGGVVAQKPQPGAQRIATPTGAPRGG
ncbi:hypothetical protein C8Q80DRAFT_1265842 [Daedaleopsis nitida]|nr:hypothetical protein C8Q80DRAFT_1265842 [Daedaleopsis nitida]